MRISTDVASVESTALEKSGNMNRTYETKHTKPIQIVLITKNEQLIDIKPNITIR